jgi:surface antigen
VDVSAFGDDRKSYIKGQHDMVAAHRGLFDSAGGTQAHQVLSDRIGSEVVFGCNYGTAGSAYGWAGTVTPQSAYAVQAPLAGAVTFSAEYKGPMHPVILLSNEGLISGDGNAFDGGAGSNAGAGAVLQVEGVTQAGTVKVQAGTDSVFTTPVDLIDFGNITGRTAVWLEASGTVRQFVRYSMAGSATAYIGFRRF